MWNSLSCAYLPSLCPLQWNVLSYFSPFVCFLYFHFCLDTCLNIFSCFVKELKIVFPLQYLQAVVSAGDAWFFPRVSAFLPPLYYSSSSFCLGSHFLDSLPPLLLMELQSPRGLRSNGGSFRNRWIFLPNEHKSASLKFAQDFKKYFQVAPWQILLAP